MTAIDLRDFIEKVRAYQKSEYAHWPSADLYRETVDRRDIWDNLGEIDDRNTIYVLQFLNQWKCRISYNCAPSLARKLRESSGLLSKFKEYRLEEISSDSLIINSGSIQEAFGRIASVRARTGERTVGATATSKILHCFNPSFFMMSDRNIRHDYGCSHNEFGYVKFMQYMKLFADALIREYSIARNIPRHSAFPSLVSECRSSARTLPKLLDEYNWIKCNT